MLHKFSEIMHFPSPSSSSRGEREETCEHCHCLFSAIAAKLYNYAFAAAALWLLASRQQQKEFFLPCHSRSSGSLLQFHSLFTCDKVRERRCTLNISRAMVADWELCVITATRELRARSDYIVMETQASIIISSDNSANGKQQQPKRKIDSNLSSQFEIFLLFVACLLCLSVDLNSKCSGQRSRQP